MTPLKYEFVLENPEVPIDFLAVDLRAPLINLGIKGMNLNYNCS